MAGVKTEPSQPDDGNNGPQPPRGARANQSGLQPLSFRRLHEIIKMQFDDNDFVLKNGYLTKGEPSAVCGAGGIGKSRLISQLIRDILTGRLFLGRWETNGQNIHVMVLQSENSCRRMQSDLRAQCSILNESEKQHIHDYCVWHTLENSDDSFLTLASDENQRRIEEAIAASEHVPDLIVWDVLRDFGIDDLNSDRDMQASLSAIGRLDSQTQHALYSACSAPRAHGTRGRCQHDRL